MGWHPDRAPHDQLPDPNRQMAWPDCDCVPCILREISQTVWAGLFSAWGEWPERERVLTPRRVRPTVYLYADDDASPYEGCRVWRSPFSVSLWERVRW